MPLKSLYDLSEINSQIQRTTKRISSFEKALLDDPAGISISTKLDYQAAAFNAVLNNISQATSLLGTAQGALGEIGGTTELGGILEQIQVRINEAAESTTTADRRTELNSEVQDLLTDINTTVSNSTFNELSLLDGTLTTTPASFQVGVYSDDTISITIGDARTTALFVDNDGVAQDLDLTSEANALTSRDILNNAIDNFTSIKTQVAVQQSRFETASSVTASAIENLQAASESYKGVDITVEQLKLTELLSIQKATILAISSSNQAYENLLALLE